MNDPHSFAGQAQLERNLRENLGTTTMGLIERERRYLRHLAIVPHSHCLCHPLPGVFGSREKTKTARSGSV